MILRMRGIAFILNLIAGTGLGCSGQPTSSTTCTSSGAGGISGTLPCDASGGNAATGGTLAAGGQGATVPDLNFQNLEGYWLTDVGIGNCIDYMSYVRFMEGSKIESIHIDNNACEPNLRGTFIKSGTYSLTGRTLEIDLEDGGRTRYDVAIESSANGPMLRTVVYAPVDNRHWHGVFVQETRDTTNNQTYYNEIQVTLEFDAPLPTSGTGSCALTTSFRVTQKQPASSIDEDYSGAFNLVQCQYGASSVDGYQAIQLSSLPDGSHPNWVKSNVQPKIWRGFHLNSVLPGCLSTSDGWEKQTGTPAGL